MRKAPKATRPVFTSTKDKGELYESVDVTFNWVSGMSISNWQKSIENLQKEYKRNTSPNNLILEVSTKSSERIGNMLSAFNLQVPLQNGQRIPLECAYQGSKVFKHGGPYHDLYFKNPAEVKRDERLKESGDISGFNFESVEFPISPSNLFYDWLYLIGLRGSNLIIELIKFDAFTDIVFNPKKSINTQARSVAIAKTLYKRGLFSSIGLDEFKSYFPTSSEDVGQLLLL